jgi:hypothetical protein
MDGLPAPAHAGRRKEQCHLKSVDTGMPHTSRYRRLNIVYDRAPDLFAAHVWIAMISILSRRLVAETQVK